jgi:hypothetical protein
MSHPHSSSIPPASGGQTQTLFFVHGSPVAMLVTNRAGEMSSTRRKFKDAQAALAWCIAHHANMAFTYPADPARN